MTNLKGFKAIVCSTFCALIFIPAISCADQAQQSANKINAVISTQVFDKAKKNENWKLAYVTGKDAQVVFMSITPKTNPKNEIGMETHPFDQVIFVVEGNAKSIVDGKESSVASGDMIYIPQGMPHNFINTSNSTPFKIISIYSDTDIPANAAYKTMSDTPKD
jgi:quercetin dioxygenase-like cupin family protein